MRPLTNVLSLLVVISGLAVPPVRAQSGVVEAAAATGVAAPANLSSATPVGSGAFSKGFIGELVLEGSADDKTGVAAASWKDPHNTFQLKATSALGGGTATPFTLDGLAANSSVELSYNRLEFPQLSHSDLVALLRPIVTRAIEHCKADPGHPLRIGMPEAAAETVCTKEAGDLKYMKYLPGTDLIAVRQALGLNRRIWFWGGGFTAARTTFDYLEEGTLAERSVEERSESWNVRAGLFTNYFGFLIGSYSFVKQHSAAGPARSICQPLEGTDAIVCEDAVIGAPVETTRSVVKGEFRKFFSGGLAFAPSVQRDLEKKITLVTLPVYFLKNKEGSATGGVRLTWRSDTEATTVSVFVGAALKPN